MIQSFQREGGERPISPDVFRQRVEELMLGRESDPNAMFEELLTLPQLGYGEGIERIARGAK